MAQTGFTSVCMIGNEINETASPRDLAAADAITPHPGSEGFSRTEITATVIIGAVSGLVVALQPLLLGRLAAEGRITLPEIGQTAMLEGLGMALATAVAGGFLRPHRLRRFIVVAAIVSLLANGISMVARQELVMLARLANGLSVGLLTWVWTGLLIRVAFPARLAAVYVTIQAGGLLTLSSFFSGMLLPRAGAAGGYACLAGISALVGVLALAAPSQYRAPVGVEGVRFQMPSGRGLVGLLAVTFHIAAIMAFWVYMLPLAKLKGLSDGFVGGVISLSLGSQVLAGLCAITFARLNARLAIYGSVAASLLGLGLVAAGSGPGFFTAGVILVVFLWMFVCPYQMPYLLEVDPSHRAAMQIITAQLLGVSVGPALASLVVHNADITPALWVSAGLYIAGGLLVFATLTVGRRPLYVPLGVQGSPRSE